MASAFSVVILDHSFIRRLKDFIECDDDFHNLRLSTSQFKIQLRGVGGLTMRRLVKLPKLYTFETVSNICFIEMGTNDLCDPKTADSVFTDITSFVELLLSNDVHFIIIGQILIRDRRNKEFNQKVIQLNNRLHVFCDTHPSMKFWHHRGFSRTDYLARDGVHIQDPRRNSQPMRKYFQSIRNAKYSCYGEHAKTLKQGSLRVLKRLEKVKPILNKRSGEYSLTAHPSGYFSFLSRTEDVERYIGYHDIHLPPPLHMEDHSGDEFCDPYSSPGTPRYRKPQSLIKRLDIVLRPHTTGRMIITPGSEQESGINQSPRSAVSESPAARSQVNQSPSSSKEKSDSPLLSSTTGSESAPDGKKRIGLKTMFSDLDAGAKTEYGVTLPETDKETEWVHVQTLTKDQTFSLQYVTFDKEKPQPSFVVISNGAEVVQISRTLYLSKLDFNARERLRSEVSPYPTDEELQHNLITRVNWEAYKDIVLQQIADNRTRSRPTTRGAKHRQMRFKLAKAPLAKSVYS